MYHPIIQTNYLLTFHASKTCYKYEQCLNESDLPFSHPLSFIYAWKKNSQYACVQIEVKLSFSESLSNPGKFTTNWVWWQTQNFHLFVSLSKSQPANYCYLLCEEKKRNKLGPLHLHHSRQRLNWDKSKIMAVHFFRARQWCVVADVLKWPVKSFMAGF